MKPSNKSGSARLLLAAALALAGAARAGESAQCNCRDVPCKILCDEGTAVATCGDRAFTGRCEKDSVGGVGGSHSGSSAAGASAGTSTSPEANRYRARLYFAIVRNVNELSEAGFVQVSDELSKVIATGWGKDGETTVPERTLTVVVRERKYRTMIGGPVRDLNEFFARLNREAATSLAQELTRRDFGRMSNRQADDMLQALIAKYFN